MPSVAAKQEAYSVSDAVFSGASPPFLSVASVEAVGGYCLEHRMYWRYDLPPELTQDLIQKAERRETCTITINFARYFRDGSDRLGNAGIER